MNELYITHYYYPGTDPWKNIMLLPEKEAFRTAEALAEAHPETTSFYRFADFVNYYPGRKAADAYMYQAFLDLGGKPKLRHPYSFVLMESPYLEEWFSGGEKLQIRLSDVPAETVSFTVGDSCAQYQRGQKPEVLTKPVLEKMYSASGLSPCDFLKTVLQGYQYMEVQLWDRLEDQVRK